MLRASKREAVAFVLPSMILRLLYTILHIVEEVGVRRGVGWEGRK